MYCRLSVCCIRSNCSSPLASRTGGADELSMTVEINSERDESKLRTAAVRASAARSI